MADKSAKSYIPYLAFGESLNSELITIEDELFITRWYDKKTCHHSEYSYCSNLKLHRSYIQ